MLLNAKVLKSNRFLKEDENGNEIIQLNGFIYHLKTKGKFMFELKLQQQNSFGVNTSKIPVQILDNFTDSHQLVCCFQKGLSSIHMIQINLSQQLSQQSKNVWKKEKESYGIVKSRNISLPFQIESIIWLNPNMLFVNDFKDNSKWKLIILENNENYQIKEISYITSFTMNAFHILLSSENTLFSNYNLKERNINNIIKDNNILLSLLNYNNQSDNSSLEILYDLCVKSSPLSPSPMNTGNPLLFNNNHSYLICKYLKHSNQFVLLTKQQLNQKSEDEKENDEYYLSIINFNRNTLRTISLSLFGYSNAVNNTKNMKSANSIFSISELPNGYLTILNCHTNQLFIYNLNIDKLTAEALDWQLYQSNSLNVKNNNEISIEYISHEDNKLKQPSFPKHGMEDDLPHVGGNTYAGGSGGFDTAGLGGVGGPYRLQKKGNPVFQIPDDVKKNLLTSEIIERAKKMANEAYQKRLQEIEMTNEEMNIYQSYKGNVLNQIEQLRKILNDLKWKDEDDERIWMKNQTNGELDDNKIVEGILGEKNIYKRRVNPNELFTKNQNQNMNKQKKKKVLHFVMDVSASMYRFNGQDGRLDRMLETVVIIMESFKGFEDKFEYRITGHSGQSSNLVFIEKNKPPKNENERLKVLLKMHAHSQYCWSGDSTLLAMKRATTAKEYDDNDFVFIFSDANLARYGIDTKDIQKLLIPTSASSSGSSSKRKKGNFIIFIASLFNEAQKLKETLPSSRCFICFDSKDLAPTGDDSSDDESKYNKLSFLNVPEIKPTNFFAAYTSNSNNDEDEKEDYNNSLGSIQSDNNNNSNTTIGSSFSSTNINNYSKNSNVVTSSSTFSPSHNKQLSKRGKSDYSFYLCKLTFIHYIPTTKIGKYGCATYPLREEEIKNVIKMSCNADIKKNLRKVKELVNTRLYNDNKNYICYKIQIVIDFENLELKEIFWKHFQIVNEMQFSNQSKRKEQFLRIVDKKLLNEKERDEMIQLLHREKKEIIFRDHQQVLLHKVPHNNRNNNNAQQNDNYSNEFIRFGEECYKAFLRKQKEEKIISNNYFIDRLQQLSIPVDKKFDLNCVESDNDEN
ncbi:hypothetical protein ABK040_000031 [Willaertia magna]